MKMVGLCWVTVVLTLFLSTGNSLAATDQNWLTSVVEGIKDNYALGDAFSVAVNVPENQDPNDLQQVLQDDPADKVGEAVSQHLVYQGTRVVAAAQSEALSRVLENMRPFNKSSEGNFLIIYSAQSPCGPMRINLSEDGITDKINDIIQNWSGYAFVFSNVADVLDADTSQLASCFQQLAISKLMLDNIFRCYSESGRFQCIGCSSGGDVAPLCVANTALSNQKQDSDVETSPFKPADTGIVGGGDQHYRARHAGRVSEAGGKCRRRGGKRYNTGGIGRRGRKQRRWGKGGGNKRRGGGKRRKGRGNKRGGGGKRRKGRGNKRGGGGKRRKGRGRRRG